MSRSCGAASGRRRCTSMRLGSWREMATTYGFTYVRACFFLLGGGVKHGTRGEEIKEAHVWGPWVGFLSIPFNHSLEQLAVLVFLFFVCLFGVWRHAEKTCKKTCPFSFLFWKGALRGWKGVPGKGSCHAPGKETSARGGRKFGMSGSVGAEDRLSKPTQGVSRVSPRRAVEHTNPKWSFQTKAI